MLVDIPSGVSIFVPQALFFRGEEVGCYSLQGFCDFFLIMCEQDLGGASPRLSPVHTAL